MGPSARELLQWASLARMLCERGWAPEQALATAWRQTYTSADPLPASCAAANAAFQEHCSSISAESFRSNSDALALSLSRPASWPLPLAASDIAADSNAATWSASSAVMTHLMRQLVALEALLTRLKQQSLPSSFDASALPAPWLQQHLKGLSTPSSSDTELVDRLGGADACQAALDRGLLLLHTAAECLIERLSPESMELGATRLQLVTLWVSSSSFSLE